MTRATSGVLLGIGLMVIGIGCGQKSKPSPASTTSPSQAFLDKTKRIPPGLEWNTDFHSKSGGRINYRIVSQGPFDITIVADPSYQAMLKNDMANFKKSDVMLTHKVNESTYESSVTVPPGRSWFIIKNNAGKDVDLHLICSTPLNHHTDVSRYRSSIPASSARSGSCCRMMGSDRRAASRQRAGSAGRSRRRKNTFSPPRRTRPKNRRADAAPLANTII